MLASDRLDPELGPISWKSWAMTKRKKMITETEITLGGFLGAPPPRPLPQGTCNLQDPLYSFILMSFGQSLAAGQRPSLPRSRYPAAQAGQSAPDLEKAISASLVRPRDFRTNPLLPQASP